MSELSKLQKKVLEFRDTRDWKKFHNPKDTAISLALEASEYLENYQWKSPEEIELLLKSDRENLSDELADILFYLLLIAADLEIDLNDALTKKLAKNEKKYPVDLSKGSNKKYTELGKS